MAERERIDRLRAAVNLAVSEKKRQRVPRAASSSIYVFKKFENVFDETTLAYLRAAYTRAEMLVDRYGSATLPDGSYVSRNGRYDVALAVPDASVTQFALMSMRDRGVDARMRTGVRALVVPRATAAQPWHTDRETSGRDPRYLTLVVALEDMAADGDGVTEFRAPVVPLSGILGGPGRAHFNPTDESLPIVRPVLRANQGILFDGRIVHRGGAATRRRPPVVYLVYTEPDLEENV